MVSVQTAEDNRYKCEKNVRYFFVTKMIFTGRSNLLEYQKIFKNTGLRTWERSCATAVTSSISKIHDEESSVLLRFGNAVWLC